MSADSELPEFQIFSVLKKGTEEPIGPYSQNELVELLNSEQIAPSDFVYYPELDGWKPISKVFDFHQRIANFEDHGQDKKMLAEAFAFLTDRSEPEESIFYIAVQHFPAMSLTAAVRLTAPKSLALTDHRFCILKHKHMGGIGIDEYPIEQIAATSTRIDGHTHHGVFSILLKSSERVEVDKIPEAQIERLEHLAASILEGHSHPGA